MENQMGYKKTLLLLCFLFFLVGCKKNDYEEVIDQPYVYPVEAAYGKSFDERTEMFKIPEHILHRLSTEALVKSCLDYPEFSLVWAYNSFQQGFDQISSRCNGFDELWERGDKFPALFSLYKQKNIDRGNWDSYTDLENGRYMFDVIYVELVISQNEFLRGMTVTEKTELFQLAFENQKKKIDLIQYWGTPGMQTTIAILGRIMYLDNYQPMVEEYNKKGNMYAATTNIFTREYDVVTKIMSLSEDYLKILKNKQK